MPVVDEDGNPITTAAPPVVVDENGNPIQQGAAPDPTTPKDARVANVIAAARAKHRDELRSQGALPGEKVDFVEPTAVERGVSTAANLAAGAADVVGGTIAGVPEQLFNAASAPVRVAAAAASTLKDGGSLADAWRAGRDVKPHREFEELASAASSDLASKIKDAAGVRRGAMTDTGDAVARFAPVVAAAFVGGKKASREGMSAAEARVANVRAYHGEVPPEAVAAPPEAPAAATTTLYHGSSVKGLANVRAGSMLTDSRKWAEGYRENINGEQVGDVYAHQFDPTHGRTVEVQSLDDAEGKLLDLAQQAKADGATGSAANLQDAAKIVNEHFGIDAIVAKRNGKVIGAIPLKDVPVSATTDGAWSRRVRDDGGVEFHPPTAMSDAAPEPQSDNANPIPSVAEVTGVAKRLAPIKEIIDGINPSGASEGAAKAADILRRSKAEIGNDAAIERFRNEETRKVFDRAGDEKNIENISNYEATGRFTKGDAFPDQESADAYSKMYQETTDAAHQTLQQVYGGDRVGYVENYVRRAFKFGTEGDEAKATGMLSNYVGSLSASKSPLKGRVLSVPLDEALTQMREAGIDVQPATTNPEVLRQWTVENANQARVYKQAWEDAKAGSLLQFVKQGDRVPSGMVQLNDRVAQVFRPTEEGAVRTGQYFAEPGVARIFNNAISKGLGGSPTFKAIRTMNNAYNQMQLGLSGFHLTGTAINAGISDVSLGLQQIIQGEVGAGAKSIGRGALPGLSFVRDMVNGREFVNGLVADDPVARQFLTEKLNPAGGRLAIDQSYRNSAYENMVKAWSNRRYIRALGNVPFAVVQKIASPLMEYAIPRVKLGAFMDLAEANRSKLGPEATDTQIQRAYEQAWDSVDNRFGQVVHDNLFWNRTAADLAQVSTRSVGWNLGTIRELGGGIADVSRGNLSPRALYAFSLPIVAGTIGAAFHYLHTGKGPETLRDYYYPKNGLTDAKGRDERASLPTYMKDVFAYSTDPVATLEHKASPLLSLAFDLGTNRDYFGDMIRNPDEARSKQLLQMGSYALKQFQPFSVQQAAKTIEAGGVLRAGEQIMGFPSAPASMKQTSDEADKIKEARRLRNENIMKANARRHGR